MPVTARRLLIGAAGLSALPPLNGFVSEWLTFQAILAGAHLPQWALKFGIAVDRRAAGPDGRAGGRVLRARLRHRLPRPAALGRGAPRRSRSPAMRPALVLLAAACVLFGVLPCRRRGHHARHRPPARPVRCRARASRASCGSSPLPDSASSYSGIVILVAIAGLGADRGAGGPPAGLEPRAAGAGLGLRLPRSAAADPIQRRQLRQPLRRVFGPRCSRPASASTCRRRAIAGPARLEVQLRDLIWDLAVRAGGRRPRLVHGAHQRAAVPDHPPLSHLHVRGAVVPAARGRGDAMNGADSATSPCSCLHRCSCCRWRRR